MIKRVGNFFKDNLWFFISVFIIVLLFNIHLPYYISTPGGVININDRIVCETCSDINGNLNMLYVSEYEATIPTYLLSYIMPNWDRENISEQQVSDEDTHDIYVRNRIMLDNSINNAIYVAYKSAGKDVNIKNKKMIVIASTMDNGLKIGDEILEIDDEDVEDVNDVKNIINKRNVGDKIKLKIIRDDKEIETTSSIKEEDGNKLLGVIIVNNYDLDMDPKIDLKFKSTESGSSGGLMMAISIYTKISGKDIVKGRNIAGTGTIEFDGTVGEIDGIKYKIIGAYKNDIDVVLVPKENYEEALKVVKDNNYDMKIVSVNTFGDAINYLSNN